MAHYSGEVRPSISVEFRRQLTSSCTLGSAAHLELISRQPNQQFRKLHLHACGFFSQPAAAFNSTFVL